MGATKTESTMRKFLLPVVTGAFVALSGAAFADTSISAVTDLNVRAGPGPQFPVVGVLNTGEQAMLKGCLPNSKWCAIDEAGDQGWVYSDYVMADFSGNRVVLTQRPVDAGIAVVDPPADVGNFSGASSGELLPGEPVTGFEQPSTEVRTYIRSNQPEPVYLDGEVVSGAVLPESVELREIPDYNYRYVYVNGQPALIDPETRRVVYVVRQ